MTETAGIVFSIIFVLCLLLIPKFAPPIFTSYFLKITGLISILYSVYDIKSDLLSNTFQITDAHLMAQFTGISSFIWGLGWFLISITTLILLLRFGYKKGYSK
jgi:hypothetical protein